MENDAPFFVDGEKRGGPWLITVDHASNRVPNWINGGDLGLPAQDMARHIAYDIGALAVARRLGELLDSPVISSNFSRLVIDPNRGADDPTLVMKLYDGTIIPANRHMSDDERARRVDELYQPYHNAYSDMAADPRRKAILAMHSFTPQLRGRPFRPWEIAVLFARDKRLSDPLIASLRGEEGLTIGANEPYNGDLPGDSVDQHALRFDRLNALIEVRNDLIEDHAGQMKWAALLAPHLTHSLNQIQET